MGCNSTKVTFSKTVSPVKKVILVDVLLRDKKKEQKSKNSNDLET